jgi:hypothetical protein
MTVMKEGSPVRADNTPQNSPGVATYSKSWGHSIETETEICKCMDVMLRDPCHPYSYTVENFMESVAKCNSAITMRIFC